MEGAWPIRLVASWAKHKAAELRPLFSERGLTIHSRGLSALVRFIGVRAELFRAIYFHRTVRAIDLTPADLFAASKAYLFPGNPLQHSPRTLFTPHTAGGGGNENVSIGGLMGWTDTFERIAENLRRVAAKEPVLSPMGQHDPLPTGASR